MPFAGDLKEELMCSSGTKVKGENKDVKMGIIWGFKAKATPRRALGFRNIHQAGLI